MTAYCDRYLDTIDSDTGELNPISALNLIVFGPKLEHLDLIEYVVVDLLKVKWNTFIKREFFKQMAMFTVFFSLAITAFIIRPLVPEEECGQEEETSSSNLTMSPLTTDMEEPPMAALLLSNATNATCEMVARQVSDGQFVSIHKKSTSNPFLCAADFSLSHKSMFAACYHNCTTFTKPIQLLKKNLSRHFMFQHCQPMRNHHTEQLQGGNGKINSEKVSGQSSSIQLVSPYIISPCCYQ